MYFVIFFETKYSNIAVTLYINPSDPGKQTTLNQRNEKYHKIYFLLVFKSRKHIFRIIEKKLKYESRLVISNIFASFTSPFLQKIV